MIVSVSQDDVTWWQIEASVTSATLLLSPTADSTNHVFGIAVQTVDGLNSGVVWHPCTYRLDSS